MINQLGADSYLREETFAIAYANVSKNPLGDDGPCNRIHKFIRGLLRRYLKKIKKFHEPKIASDVESSNK